MKEIACHGILGSCRNAYGVLGMYFSKAYYDFNGPIENLDLTDYIIMGGVIISSAILVYSGVKESIKYFKKRKISIQEK